MRHSVEDGWPSDKKVIKSGYSKPKPLSTGNLVERIWLACFYFLSKGHLSWHLRSPTDTSSHPQWAEVFPALVPHQHFPDSNREFYQAHWCSLHRHTDSSQLTFAPTASNQMKHLFQLTLQSSLFHFSCTVTHLTGT